MVPKLFVDVTFPLFTKSCFIYKYAMMLADIWVIADMAVRFELMPERLCMWLGIWYMADILCTPLNMLEPGNTVMLF